MAHWMVACSVYSCIAILGANVRFCRSASMLARLSVATVLACCEVLPGCGRLPVWGEDLFFGRVCPCGWERLVIRNVVVGRLRAAEDVAQQAADVAALQEAWRESPRSGSPGCSREASRSTWVGVTADGILRLPMTGKTPVLTVSTTKTRSAPPERVDLSLIGRVPPGACLVWLHSVRESPQCRGMMTFSGLALGHCDPSEPFTGRLRLEAAAYLARFKGSSAHPDSDLRCYLTWCAERAWTRRPRSDRMPLTGFTPDRCDAGSQIHDAAAAPRAQTPSHAVRSVFCTAVPASRAAFGSCPPTGRRVTLSAALQGRDCQ
jgi:hypothetical protein